VSDNHTPTPCQTVATMTIKCDGGPVCGNGVVETGETCDPPNGTTCSATCQTIAGTGGTGGAAGAAGHPATGGSTGTGGVAGTTGTGGAPATGGSTGTGGIVSTGGSTGTGGTAVFAQDNAACVSCEQTGTTNGVCFTTSTTGGGTSAANFGCDGFANATDKQHCLDLLGCLRSTGCQNVIAAAGSDYGEAGVNFDDVTPCLCNSATTTVTKTACLGQTSWTTGVCAAQFVAASNNATSNSTPVSSLFDPAYPVGVASNLMTCDIDTKQTGSGTPNCTTAATCKVPQ
jgi:hypothetical protein